MISYEGLSRAGVKTYECPYSEHGKIVGTLEEWIIDDVWYRHIHRERSCTKEGKEHETFFVGDVNMLIANYAAPQFKKARETIKNTLIENGKRVSYG